MTVIDPGTRIVNRCRSASGAGRIRIGAGAFSGDACRIDNGLDDLL